MLRRAILRAACWLTVPATLFALQAALAQQPPATRAARSSRPARPPQSQPTAERLGPLRPMAANDIQMLRLLEFNPPAEDPRLRMKFKRPRGARRLTDEAIAALKAAGTLTREKERALREGGTVEQLALIIEATGLRFAERVEFREDPRTFRVFREAVLPRIVEGCVRSNCHGGEAARVFRLPVTGSERENLAYASFLVLDSLTVGGQPLLNRNDPGNSPLLAFLLPPTVREPRHPPVRGVAVPPLFANEHVRDFVAIRDWIAMLRTPHPAYQLTYEYPEWLQPPRPPAGETPATQPGR